MHFKVYKIEIDSRWWLVQIIIISNSPMDGVLSWSSGLMYFRTKGSTVPAPEEVDEVAGRYHGVSVPLERPVSLPGSPGVLER